MIDDEDDEDEDEDDFDVPDGGDGKKSKKKKKKKKKRMGARKIRGTLSEKPQDFQVGFHIPVFYYFMQCIRPTCWCNIP